MGGQSQKYMWFGTALIQEKYDPQKGKLEDLQKLRQRYGIAKDETMILSWAV